MTFYRKYRPQTLDELIGQKLVKNSLQQTINARKVAHAYLFCGPKGTGKTSTARILAKIINCEAGDSKSHIDNRISEEKNIEQEGNKRLAINDIQLPCNICPTCISITEGSNMDVVEMDAASNRGIEDIRALRENIKLAPSSARKKVYIIDEVHMLTGEAFNALLKTLEEPPSHVVFILATTDPQKIPQTILSRVQRLDFKLASADELVEALEKIVAVEKINIDKDSLLLLARKAGGSFRDAEKFLDQLSSLEKITVEDIEQHLGLWDAPKLVKILNATAEKDPKLAISLTLEQIEKGASPKELNSALLETLRQIIFIKNGLGSLVRAEVKEEDYQVLEDLADKMTVDSAIYTISNLQTSLEQLRYVTIPSMPLEVALLKSSLEISEQTTQSPEKIEQKTIKLEENTKQIKTEEVKISNPVKTEEKKDVLDQVEKVEETIKKTDDIIVSTSLDLQKIAERWNYLLETIRQNNFSLEALLRSSRILGCEKNIVVIAVPYSFHQRILEAPKSKNLIEAVLSEILERPIMIGVEITPKKMAHQDIANVEVAQDDEIIRLAAEIFSSDGAN